MKNIAFYIVIIIIIFHIITIFVFGCKQNNSLIKIIKDIIFAIKNYNLLDKKTKSEVNKSKKTEENINNINKNKNKKNNINNDIIKRENKIQNRKKGKKGKKGKYPFEKNKKEKDNAFHININNEMINNNDNSNHILTINRNKKIKNKKRNITTENISKASSNLKNIASELTEQKQRAESKMEEA